MKILLFSNTDWFMFNFNLPLANRLRQEGHQIILLSPPGVYAAKMQDLGFRWVAAPMGRGSLNIFREVALIIWLVKFFLREHIDLIHSFTIKCVVYGSLAARIARIPARINTVAGMGYVFASSHIKAKVLRPMVEILMHVSLGGKHSRLIVLNHSDFNFFRNTRIVDQNSIYLVPGAGIDCQKFSPSNKIRRRSLFTVLLPARLLWDKGVAEYVESARILKVGGNDYDFLLAGSLDPENPSAVTELKINEWTKQGLVRWLGHIDDMPALFQSVDVVVLPSYREGLPTGLTEAGACALPLITTDVPGCNEVVTNEIDGLLVPIKNPKSIADALSRLKDDPALCYRLGRAARAKAVSQFDNKIVIQRTLDVYKGLIEKLPNK